jgi:predicted dienelactone hydrolase
MEDTMRWFAWCALAACTSTPEPAVSKDDTPWSEPGAPGFWQVSTTSYTLDDGSLPLPVQVWTPTLEETSRAATYDGLPIGHAIAEAPPACDTPRPVVVFSHGNAGKRYQSVFLTEWLAAHGYLVAAPDHIGNTTLDVDTVPRSEVAIRRPQDIQRTFDSLIERADDPQDQLFGCLDPAAGYAIVGHSFGGYTALATAGAPLDLQGLATACDQESFALCGVEEVWASQFPDDPSGFLGDSRVWASIALTPAGIGALGATMDQIKVPTMIIGAVEDITTPWDTVVRPLYTGLTVTPRVLAGLSPVGHYSFTNFCVFADDGCSDAFVPVEDVHQLTNTLTTAFLDISRGESRAERSLRGDDPMVQEWIYETP